MKDRRVLDEAAVRDYRRIHRALQHAVLPEWVRLGVSMPQYKALTALDKAGQDGITVTALGAALSIGQPSASLLVEQLVRAGLASRATDPRDRRRALVTTTPQGGEMLAGLRLGRERALEAWTARLGDDDARALATGLAALAEAAEATQRECDGPGATS
jgi:DNA-binding MarR family transcriptional regulator